MLFWLFLILMFVLLIALLPTWPYSAEWGYYPAGGIVVLFLLLLLLFWWMAWLPWAAA